MIDMDDRIDGLEKDVSELKSDVSVLKADVSVLKTDVSVLKADFAQLNTKVAVIHSNYATKADIAQLEATMLKLFLGGLIAMAGMFVAAAKYLH
jgi:outer membrane murein-binding lipoprotein Lpp